MRRQSMIVSLYLLWWLESACVWVGEQYAAHVGWYWG